MKKLIIHIGFPKTATSSLQLNIFSELMATGEIEYLNHLDLENKKLGNISVKNIITSIVGLNKNIDYSAEIEEISKIKHPLSIISTESISHVSEHSLNASYKKSAHGNGKKIKSILSDHFDSIEIIMTIRSQKTIIPSYFTQEYFNIIHETPDFKDIGKWLKENFNEQIKDDDLIFNYYKMYTTYAELFGEDNVHILLYEDLLHNKIKFYTKLSKILNIKLEKIQNYFEFRNINITVKSSDGKISTDGQSLKSLLSLYTHNIFRINNKSNAFKIAKNILNIPLIHKIFSFKIGKPTTVRGLSDDEINLINKRFLSSNKKLFKKLNLDTTNSISEYF